MRAQPPRRGAPAEARALPLRAQMARKHGMLSAMRVLRPAAVLAAAALAAAAPSAPAQHPKRLPPGAVVAGVGVGGLGPIGAKRELRRVVGGHHERTVTVRIGARDHPVSTRRAGLTIDYDGMVKRAFAQAARGMPINVPLSSSIAGERLTEAVRALARRLHRPARDARVRFGISRVQRVRHRSGQALDAGPLRRALLAELRVPTETRVVKAAMRTVHPKVTLRELPGVHHTFISINRSTFKLRLFKRLRVVRTYGVAVGAGGYDTPSGLHRILAKHVNPAWTAPKRAWAGALAGKTIPPGDPRNPLKARFLAIGNGVGIHGTAEEWSIGSRASHGCIRMRVRDVKLLYPRVPVGTPVLIR